MPDCFVAAVGVWQGRQCVWCNGVSGFAATKSEDVLAAFTVAFSSQTRHSSSGACVARYGLWCMKPRARTRPCAWNVLDSQSQKQSETLRYCYVRVGDTHYILSVLKRSRKKSSLIQKMSMLSTSEWSEIRQFHNPLVPSARRTRVPTWTRALRQRRASATVGLLVEAAPPRPGITPRSVGIGDRTRRQ